MEDIKNLVDLLRCENNLTTEEIESIMQTHNISAIKLCAYLIEKMIIDEIGNCINEKLMDIKYGR